MARIAYNDMTDLAPELAEELAKRPVANIYRMLANGGSAALGFLKLGGALRFERGGAWIGYRVSFDPTLPWLLASALLGVGGLVVHTLGDLRPRCRARETLAAGAADRSCAHA